MNKSNINNLELGNVMFNPNAIQWYICPNYIIALLESIENELCRIMWNKNHKEYDSPFRNTANSFELSDVFRVEAYNWNDEIEQEYNFIYYKKDLKISWYKYLGRDTTINQEINSSEMIEIYNDIMEKLREYESGYKVNE